MDHDALNSIISLQLLVVPRSLCMHVSDPAVTKTSAALQAIAGMGLSPFLSTTLYLMAEKALVRDQLGLRVKQLGALLQPALLLLSWLTGPADDDGRAPMPLLLCRPSARRLRGPSRALLPTSICCLLPCPTAC